MRLCVLDADFGSEHIDLGRHSRFESRLGHRQVALALFDRILDDFQLLLGQQETVKGTDNLDSHVLLGLSHVNPDTFPFEFGQLQRRSHFAGRVERLRDA